MLDIIAKLGLKKTQSEIKLIQITICGQIHDTFYKYFTNMEQEIAAQVVGLGGVNDFSLWQLFLRADFVVKSVIILLLASSIYSWALIFDKYKLFKKINLSTLEFENKFWKARSAESLHGSLPTKSEDP